MKITKIEIQKKNNKRYNLYMDDEFKCGVHEDVIVLLGLHVNMIIDDQVYNDIILKEEYAKAKSAALKFIAYRLRSRQEVIDKLQKLELSADIIQTTLDFLDEFKFINDYEFAKAFIHDKATISKHPMKRIVYDLRNKGIDKQTIEKAKQYYDDQMIDFDYDNAKVLSLKKYKQVYGKKKYSDYEVKQKVYQYLVQKGYNLYIVKDALNDALSEEPID